MGSLNCRFILGFCGGSFLIICSFLPWINLSFPQIPMLGKLPESLNGWEISSQMVFWSGFLEYIFTGKVSGLQHPGISIYLPWILILLGAIICGSQLLGLIYPRISGVIGLSSGLLGTIILSGIWGVASFLEQIANMPLRILGGAPGYGIKPGLGIYLGLTGGILGLISGVIWIASSNQGKCVGKKKNLDQSSIGRDQGSKYQGNN